MKKRDLNEKNHFHYDEDGAQQVSEQIMNSYNSGVIDQRHDEQVFNDNSDL